ncbi:MAG: TetR family transcriptional regulator C-terminal domain-containing protein [Rhizobiales bacterium]|nr:TetR family transcriptional regulator C-terminal domain-containing protein [Hyphomicrobiales bacterium]MBI3674034.1 TetR family transcriptional regulator C-terminal domain-containing protein [Hyphomicrobiales bacterium]
MKMRAFMSQAKPAQARKTRIQAQNEGLILDAALEVFSAYGYRGSTVDQIAAKCGLSKPNLLYYFRRKEDIYTAVLERTLTGWLEPLRALDPDGDPVAELTGYITAKMELSRDNPEASRLFANEILHGAPMIGKFLKGPLKDLVDAKAAIVRAWIAQGRLASVDPYHLIFAIWATTQHYADFEVQVRAILGDKSDPTVVGVKTLITLIMDGLRPR